MADQSYNPAALTPEEQELWDNAKCSDDYRAVWKMRDERVARYWDEKDQKAWCASEAAEALKQLGLAYAAYKQCLDRDPNLEKSALANDEANQRIFATLRSNLERANNAPRCAHIKANGERCRAPKMRGRRLCNMHLAMEDASPKKISLPALDDPNGIQVAIMKAAQGLLDGTLEQKQASLLAYFLQIAANNVGKVNFEPDYEDEHAEKE